MPTGDYLVQDVKGIKKSFDNSAKLSLEQYKALPIFTIETTDEFSEIFTSTEALTGVRELGEQETPDTLKLNDGRSVTITSKRFGGAIEVTSTDRVKMKDSSVKVQKYLTRQRDQLLKNITQVFVVGLHTFLNDAFAGASYLAPDGVALCGAHLNSSGGAWFTNSATPALASSAIDTAFATGGAFVDPSGNQDPKTWTHIVVKLGSAASRQAKKLFAFGIQPTAISDINIYKGELTIIETPYITAANAAFWFLFDLRVDASPLYAGITQSPAMQEPIRQNNGAIRSNVEGFWSQGIVNAPGNVWGSNGTT